MPEAMSQYTSGAGSSTLGLLPGPRPKLVPGLLALLLPGVVPLIVSALWGMESHHSVELPSYSLSLACEGCSPQQPPRLGLSSIMDLTLRPSSRVSEPVAVRAALFYDTGVEPWPVAFAPSSTGTFRLRRPVKDLPRLRPGLRQMVFAVGRPQELPASNSDWISPNSEIQLLWQPLEIMP
jgi:hypothetical protein